MDRDDVSRLLDEVRGGDSRAFESLISLVYDELSAMRQVLIAEAGRRSAQKREGGLTRVTFRDLNVATDAPELDLLALEEAMTALGRVDERFTRVIELRYFAGCTLEEIAEITGRSLASVKRDWAYARAWLFERMTT
jgi:RNA polymerase sigma-70 factor, ECF subfamily